MKFFFAPVLMVVALPLMAQRKPAVPVIPPAAITSISIPKPGPKPYKEVITDKAISQKGLFTVHKVDDKWYFEIADSVMNREILAVTRYSRTPAGGNSYGGEKVNEQTIRWEKGPANNIFLRVITVVNIAPDSTQPISQAVRNSNLDPIAAAFDIKAFGKDSAGVVIDVTDFFKGDNQPVSLSAAIKRKFNLNGIASDRSYIQSIHSYPVNTEIKTVKTFSSAPSPGGFTLSLSPSTSLPASEAAGAVTLELNNSFILLPEIPMRKRLLDTRVGYFANSYTVYTDEQQRAETSTFIQRWRLEPKNEDLDKWKRGELVEPKKQIIYYIDPATPKKWRSYLIAGINDWQKAFEKAGFKNAIIGKEWPENDTSMSLEDARFSVIRYFASSTENAYGPREVDPRSGEILESHVGWYHNVMKLLHTWYMIQTAAVDPRARKMKFDDELMGTLIRFVSSHEIGHTLGLRHNMGSSSETPVEKLRNKAWVEANGHTVSIMDYARFNYVAQPEDNIGPAGLYPRIGDYDKWAIQWGYKSIMNTKDEEEDKKILNKWIVDSISANPRLWFGGESQNFDPRSQREDLGDDNMKASEYGIQNLKRILPNLPQWTKEEADKYDNLEEMYGGLLAQFSLYMDHVSKNIGGIYETFKSVEQTGDIYEATPKAIQQKAVAFLNKELFETPAWLLNKDILNKFSNPASTEGVGTIQANVLNNLLSTGRLFRISASTARFGANTYTIDEFIGEVKKGIWNELVSKKPIDVYRRNLQKTYTEALVNLLDPPQVISIGLSRGIASLLGGDIKNTDIPSVARANLNALKNEIAAAIPGTRDKLSRYHLQDVLERIKKALNPKQ
jgi:ribosomal protein S18 acetylase RimI-like enzyme